MQRQLQRFSSSFNVARGLSTFTRYLHRCCGSFSVASQVQRCCRRFNFASAALTFRRESKRGCDNFSVASADAAFPRYLQSFGGSLIFSAAASTLLRQLQRCFGIFNVAEAVSTLQNKRCNGNFNVATVALTVFGSFTVAAAASVLLRQLQRCCGSFKVDAAPSMLMRRLQR